MKRAYKKRKKYRINYTMLIALLAIIVMVVVCIAGIVAIIGLSKEKEPDINESITSGQENTESSGETTTQGDSVSETESSEESKAQNVNDSTNADVGSNSDVDSAPGDYSCFSNTAFIGDSRIGGLFLNTQITEAKFYYAIGMHVYDALSRQQIVLENGSKGTVAQALQQGKFDKVFIQLGINDLGYTQTRFVDYYQQIINTVKQIQPQAQIYVLSMIPVSEQRSAKGDEVNNENVRIYDELAKKAAQNCGVNYVDLREPLFNGAYVLPADCAGDGVHLNKDYSYRLLNYLKSIIE